MSTQPSDGQSALLIAEVLQAFFRLDAATQQDVQQQVERLRDPQASAAERDRAQKRLTALLRLRGMLDQPGRVLGREERMTPALQELRGRMEQAEAAFASALARLMAERQLTQAQLAERVGVGQSAISMLLKRRCRPQRRTLGKLAAALGVTVEDLWPGFGTGWRSGLM